MQLFMLLYSVFALLSVQLSIAASLGEAETLAEDISQGLRSNTRQQKAK